MTTSRRNFLKTTAIVGAGVAVDGVSAFAEPIGNMNMGTSGLQARTQATTNTPEYTRGVGVYPGEPSADFGPILIPDSANYRNLALLRPAYHSSSYDYNLTAQLVTDGIKADSLPRMDRRLRPISGPDFQRESRSNRRSRAHEHHGAARSTRTGRHPARRRRCGAGNRPHPALCRFPIPGVVHRAHFHGICF